MIDNKELIEEIKKTTDLCDTFCCYEDCEKCVGRYVDYLNKKAKQKEEQ